MTKELYIHWLENMIQGCDDLQGLEKEKAIYQHCLKKARKLEEPLLTYNNDCECDDGVCKRIKGKCKNLAYR